MLSAWPLGCDLSSLTRHIPVSPEAGSILTSPLLRNINGASGAACDSLQAANALWPWGEGREGPHWLSGLLKWEWWRGGPSCLHWRRDAHDSTLPQP